MGHPRPVSIDQAYVGWSTLARRDDESFVTFVAERGTALLRTANLLCGARSDAEDILQTALEKAYRHWGKLSSDSNPEPYVRKILVNLTVSRARRWRVLREVYMPSPPELPAASESSTVELRGMLMDELRRLGPRQRAVLVLRYWEDMSEAETAKMLGCSVGTVKSQAARGLARLRERMGTSAQPASSRG
ncbi:MAG: polymerase, sigma-24 subunit, subfamily [Actinoallomurus sp.]|nr:polymerase, sigma-24 subunit, subfamily [Actinoallomurus sp.]